MEIFPVKETPGLNPTTETIIIDLVAEIRLRLSDGKPIANDDVRRLADEHDLLSELLTEAREGWRKKDEEAYRLRFGMEQLLKEQPA